METMIFLQVFSVLGSLILSLLLTVLILRIFNTRIWKRGRKKTTAVLGAIILLIPALMSVSILSAEDTTDYTKEFDYNYSVINRENSKRAKILHNMMGSIGIRDPTGFLFLTPPDIDEKAYRISVERGEPYYSVTMGNNTYDTLLQVPTEWLDDLSLLTMKVWDFLEVPLENISRVSVNVSAYKDLINGDNVEAVINIKDSVSNGMVIVVITYTRSSGFATINVVYTTTEYNRERISEVYAEVIYEGDVHALNGVMVLVLFLFPMLSLGWFLTFILPRTDHVSFIDKMVFGDSLTREEEVMDYANGVWRMN